MNSLPQDGSDMSREEMEANFAIISRLAKRIPAKPVSSEAMQVLLDNTREFLSSGMAKPYSEFKRSQIKPVVDDGSTDALVRIMINNDFAASIGAERPIIFGTKQHIKFTPNGEDDYLSEDVPNQFAVHVGLFDTTSGREIITSGARIGIFKGSIPRPEFVEIHGLFTEEQAQLALARVAMQVEVGLSTT